MPSDGCMAPSEASSSELAWDWRTYGDYTARVAASGLSLNVVPLAGHTTIRAAVMGFDQRAPTATSWTACVSSCAGRCAMAPSG